VASNSMQASNLNSSSRPKMPPQQIDLEIAESSRGKPEQPKPEDFGLAPERIRVLREPISTNKVWGNRWLWIGHAAVVLVSGVVTYEGTQSIVDTGLILFFGFFFYLFAMGILIAGGIAAFSSIWRRFQSDYREYAQYTREMAAYQVRFVRWVRMQDLWWQTLNGRRFEIELAMFLERLGYDVQCTGRAGDGGIDLVLSQDGRQTIVQCKAHKNPIGPGPVRDLYGTMIHGNVKEAWLVTTTGFSRAAQEFAKGKRIRLLRVRELLKADRPLDP
jgi:hypothetical protein